MYHRDVIDYDRIGGLLARGPTDGGAVCAWVDGALDYEMEGPWMRYRVHQLRGTLATATALTMAVLATALSATIAQAHAAYKSSIPAANAVLKTAPATVSITFVQRLSPQGLAITVYGNKGNVVSVGTAQISPRDPYTAAISMKGDDSDIYRVDWNNVSAEDNDPTLGAFVFAVDASGKSDKVTQPTATVAPTGVSNPAAVVIGLGGLVVGAGGTYFAMRSRRASR
jgi:methionine-rich copper-binding protein CopC